MLCVVCVIVLCCLQAEAAISHIRKKGKKKMKSGKMSKMVSGKKHQMQYEYVVEGRDGTAPCKQC